MDPAFAEKLGLLVGKLTDKLLADNLKRPFAFIHIILVENIVKIAPCSSLRDLRLPNPSVHENLPPLDGEMDPINYAEALANLKEFSDLFFTGPHNFGLVKGTLHLLELKDDHSF